MYELYAAIELGWNLSTLRSGSREDLMPGSYPHGGVIYGKYLLVVVLGEGGFGITYIGLDLTLLIAVAIKEYFPNGLVWRKCDKTRSSYQVTPYTPESKVLFERGKDDFLKEARVLSQFGTQEGIVRTRSFFEENDSVYLVMDYVRGGSIKDYVKRNGPFSPQNCWNILHNPIRHCLTCIRGVLFIKMSAR